MKKKVPDVIGLLLRRFDKLPEEVSCPFLVCQPFRVPLYSESEGMFRQFYGFNQSIRGSTGYAQNRSYIFETLVVQAVDADNRLTKDLCDAGTLFELHLMDEHRPTVAGVIMVERSRKLIRDVCVESSAEGNVDHLASTADAEEGFAIGCRSLDHLQFNGITRRVHTVDAGMRVAGKMVKRHVSAAGEEDPVQSGINCIPSVIRHGRGDQDRYASRLLDRADVGLLQKDGRLTV